MSKKTRRDARQVWTGRNVDVVASYRKLPRSVVPDLFPPTTQGDLFPPLAVSRPLPEWPDPVQRQRVWIGPTVPKPKTGPSRGGRRYVPTGVLLRAGRPGARPVRGVCPVRRARRESLFALNIAGRKGLGRSGVRRTAASYYSCGG